MSETPMTKTIAKESIQQLFTEARTHHFWQDKPISEQTLRELYELMKWGPTSVNSAPARIVFVRSESEKARLYPALMGSNIEQVKSAPVTAIIAYNEKFYEDLPRLFPSYDARHFFTNDPKFSYDTAFRNSSLQGAYLIFAARALGLDACPMSGFDNAEVDRVFFSGTALKSNFICTLGYGDSSKLYPRGPRLAFEEVCTIV
nr:malonic semialdehyde reductase [Cystobacter fuscus]